MALFDITQPIAAYSTHFFPADAGIPVFVTVYKTGSATYDDVAGYLVFTDQPLSGAYRDRILGDDRVLGERTAIVKHFCLSQFAMVQSLLQNRLDHQRLTISIHYVGDELAGGWTTLDAGASPGLEASFESLVTSPPPPAKPAPAVALTKSKSPAKKAAKKK